MEQINTTELADEAVFPDSEVLKRVLGESFRLYGEMMRLFGDSHLSCKWRFYRDGKAWLCKVQKKHRTIVWMSAWKGYMKATVYLAERHLADLCNLDISSETIGRIKGAKRAGKSIPCMFEISSADSLRDLRVVMEYKIAAK